MSPSQVGNFNCSDVIAAVVVVDVVVTSHYKFFLPNYAIIQSKMS